MCHHCSRTPHIKLKVISKLSQLIQELALFLEPYCSEISSFVIVTERTAALKSILSHNANSMHIKNLESNRATSIGHQQSGNEIVPNSFDSSKIAIVEFVNEVTQVSDFYCYTHNIEF